MRPRAKEWRFLKCLRTLVLLQVWWLGLSRKRFRNFAYLWTYLFDELLGPEINCPTSDTRPWLTKAHHDQAFETRLLQYTNRSFSLGNKQMDNGVFAKPGKFSTLESEKVCGSAEQLSLLKRCWRNNQRLSYSLLLLRYRSKIEVLRCYDSADDSHKCSLQKIQSLPKRSSRSLARKCHSRYGDPREDSSH